MDKPLLVSQGFRKLPRTGERPVAIHSGKPRQGSCSRRDKSSRQHPACDSRLRLPAACLQLPRFRIGKVRDVLHDGLGFRGVERRTDCLVIAKLTHTNRDRPFSRASREEGSDALHAMRFPCRGNQPQMLLHVRLAVKASGRVTRIRHKLRHRLNGLVGVLESLAKGETP